MKIAINCADLDESRIDGTRVYIKNVLKHFGELNQVDQFLLYHRNDFNPLLKPEKFPNYIEKKIPYKFAWTQTRLAYELMNDRPDVCWMPIQQVPFLVSKKIKMVVTVHDLAFKLFPKSFDYGRLRKLDFFHDTAVNRADKIIAISEATKKDLLKFHPKIKEEKISVVHHGFDKKLFEENFSEQEIFDFKKKYGIKEPYLLYVGAIQPRKNIERLVEAFEMIKRKEKKDLKLVMVGEKAWKSEAIMERIRKSEFNSEIILAGKVDFQDLALFYNQAEIFVYPSIYEGFGIPILEAMASGTPVVTAGNSSLVEIAGDSAEIFETENVQDLFEKIRELLLNDSRKSYLIEKGFERVKGFSWRKCAEETLNILKR